ncbi:hypothetical protein [Yersinia mollaretii]|uniref:hypothetical protein n=1 Tax=Yersinia mollaretii TaxID=33060 RepID=UPI00119F7684|nr:hypothetical protein [Yersinia mollaretii]
MSQIKRFSMKQHPESGFFGMPETKDGGYVHFSDYAELEKKYQALVAEKSSLYVSLFNHGYGSGHHDTVEGHYTDIHRSDMTTYHDDVVGELVEDLLRDMPATTQALNEIEARAIENALDAQVGKQAVTDELTGNVYLCTADIRQFAASLRGNS